MKWLKKLFILSAILPVFLIHGANAQNYYDAFRVDLSSSTAYGTLSNYSGSISSSGVVFTRGATSGSDYINQINMCRTQIYPKNALVFFTIKNSNRVPIVLTSGSNNYSVENISYGEYGDVSYTIYLDNTTNEYTCLSFYVDSAELTGGGTINITKPNGIILTPGATRGQIETIANLINQMLTDQDTANDTLDDILTAINGLNLSGITNAINSQKQQQHSDSQAEQRKLDNISNAIEEQNEKDEQDRNNIESQSSSTENSADSAQDDVESATSGISANISTIIGAFNTSATDCKLRVNTGSLDLGNINLCNAPSSIRSLINNIMSIIVTISVLMVSYSVIKAFLRLYEGFVGK